MIKIYIGMYLDTTTPKSKDDLINVRWRQFDYKLGNDAIGNLLSGYSKVNDCHVYSPWRVTYFIEEAQ